MLQSFRKLNQKALSPSEKVSIVNSSWSQRAVISLESGCTKSWIQLKLNLSTPKWFFSRERLISSCLHRLRSGHHHLNSFSHRMEAGADPSCRNRCEAIESEEHCLMVCPSFKPQRRNIRRFLASKNLPFNLVTVLGLNPDASFHDQFSIRIVSLSYFTPHPIHYHHSVISCLFLPVRKVSLQGDHISAVNPAEASIHPSRFCFKPFCKLGREKNIKMTWTT